MELLVNKRIDQLSSSQQSLGPKGKDRNQNQQQIKLKIF